MPPTDTREKGLESLIVASWLADQLLEHKRDGKPIFDSIIVVTDRRVLDKQIPDSIKHSRGCRRRSAQRCTLPTCGIPDKEGEQTKFKPFHSYTLKQSTLADSKTNPPGYLPSSALHALCYPPGSFPFPSPSPRGSKAAS